MLLLRYGDRLPTVATVQHIINICRQRETALSGIDPVAVDGIYLSQTRDAVRAIASALNIRNVRDGRVLDGPIWRALSTIARVRIVDVIDLCIAARVERHGVDAARRVYTEKEREEHPDYSDRRIEQIVERRVRSIASDARDSRAHYDRLIEAGGSPIALTEFAQPFSNIAAGLRERSADGWSVGIVRFQGHGSPASQGIAGSLLGWASITSDDLSFDIDDTREELDRTVRIGRMLDATPRWASVELHGCRIGAIRRVQVRATQHQRGGVRVFHGPSFIQDFAEVVKRPVCGGVPSNMFGSSATDYRIEGQVVTKLPGGASMAEYYNA